MTEEDKVARLKARAADKAAGGRSVRQHTQCVPQEALRAASEARETDQTSYELDGVVYESPRAYVDALRDKILAERTPEDVEREAKEAHERLMKAIYGTDEP